jgi:hypothetical protein
MQKNNKNNAYMAALDECMREKQHTKLPNPDSLPVNVQPLLPLSSFPVTLLNAHPFQPPSFLTHNA